MFGYITINKAEMKFKEFDVYHSYYCGLCKVLRRRYGTTGQLSLSYDLTFLQMLLSGLHEPKTMLGSCKCVAHPLEKHEIRTNEITDYIADMNVVLAFYKSLDDWEDERKWTRLLYSKLLHGRQKRLQTKRQRIMQQDISQEQQQFYERKIEKIGSLMKALSACEKNAETDIDKMAGLFGQVMAEVVAYKQDEWYDNLYTLGLFLGKFIYLLDAYEDIEEDLRKGNYNPLTTLYKHPDFEEECRSILTMMMAQCCKEFEKLPILENVDILRNILYSGVWTKYELVKEKRKKQDNKQDNKKDNKNV